MTKEEKEILKAKERYEQHVKSLWNFTGGVKKGEDLDRDKRIKRAREDYAYFVKTYFPHLASSECGKFQISAANYIKDNNRARAVFEWARGHAKSSHISLIIPLWLKIQERKEAMVMVLISKSEKMAKRLLSDLQAELVANQIYINDFGEQKTNGLWTDGEFVTADNSMFIALGRGQSPRGIKNRGVRVNYISIDDIDDDELCRNPRRVEEVVDWCLTALMGTMAMGRGRFILVGNRISQCSVLAGLCKRPNFHHTIVNALNRQGNPTWKENYTKKEIEALRVEMGDRRFQKEYMNNPIIEGAIFEKKYIQYTKILPLRQYKRLIVYTDPSFKAGSSNDFKATMLVGATKEGLFHVIKAYADQTTVTTLVQWHYDIKNFVGDNPVSFYIESNFIQDLLLEEFKKVGESIGVQIPILGDKRKKPDKFARIENLQPLFQRGYILFNQDEQNTFGMQVLEEQLLAFQKGSNVHDDAPDALEGAIWLLNNRLKVINSTYSISERKSRKY